MTTTNQTLKPFAELQAEALTEHAVRTYADPKSAPEHRDAAKKHLLNPVDKGIDWTRVPLERRRQIMLAIDDLKRLEEDGTCFAGELDNASEFARAYQACDGRISAGEFALLQALKLTPHERRQRWDDLKLVEAYGLLRVGGIELSKPAVAGITGIAASTAAEAAGSSATKVEAPEQVPLVTQPFNMPVVESVEPSAADFIELDATPSRPENRVLTDEELKIQDPEADKLIKQAKTMDMWNAINANRRRWP